MPTVLESNTLDALGALSAAGCLSPEDAAFFAERYRFMRSVEARLRLMNTVARHDLPEDEVTAYADAHAGTARLAWASPVFAASYMHRLKLAFDPYNVLNAGLVHADAAA